RRRRRGRRAASASRSGPRVNVTSTRDDASLDPLIPAHRDPPIFAEFPDLRALPWRPLVHAPTPVEPCRSAWVGHGGIFQKRDDRVSPIYGGNKIRRFEFLLADAEDRGAQSLVTVGGLASTQVMATVLFGKRLGFDVHAALFEQPITSFARSALLT